MEINESNLPLLEWANSGDTAVYRVENGMLRALLCSPGLPAMSGMTREEYCALTEPDAAAIVLDADRPMVAAKLAEVLQSRDSASVFPLTYRIMHRQHGFIWVRAQARLIGENEGAPVLMVSFETLESASAEFSELIDHIDMSIYVIDKQTYELLYVNENALQNNGNRSYQNARCYRYFNGLEAPCPWCSLPLMKDGCAHVAENYVPPLDRWYRHDVRDICWYGHAAAAFFATNITDQKRRQKLDEERFSNLYRQIAAANPDALAIFRLNLTKNICSDAQSPYEVARRQQSSRTVDGSLAACTEIIADKGIRQDCLARFTLPNLLREFQNGVTEMSVEYPIRSSEGDTIWVNGVITMMQNSVSGDVEGIAYATNVTNRKINDGIFGRIAEEKYDHIGLINPVTGSCELWKDDSAYRLGPHRRVDYQAVLGDILEHHVCPEDRELFADHGKLENIISRLNRDGSDTFVYRCFSKTGSYLYKQVKYVWLDSREDLIIESQSDLTSLYEHQIEQVKRQHEAELAKERALNAESIPAGIGVFDVEDGKLCLNYLNDGFYQMVGTTREAYAPYEGSNLIDAVFAEDRPALLHGVSAAIRDGRQLRCRVRILFGTGDFRWVEVVGNHVPLNARTERFYAAYYDVDELIRTQMELREKELLFRDILTYSDILHFAYYPERRRYESEILPASLEKMPKAMDGYPDTFIRYIGLSDSDAEAYRAMVQAIDRGAPEAECTVLMHYESRSGWYRVHLLSVPDKSGRTSKAIGNVFNVNRVVEAEKAIADERLRVESLQGVYLATACFNVTRDAETTFNAGGGLTRAADIRADTLAGAKEVEPDIEKQRPETLATLLSAAEQIPDEAQRREFIRCCSHEGMLRLFREGRRDVTIEYRRFLSGELTWVSTRIILMAEPSTGDVLAFFYTRDVSEQKKTEQITRLTLEKNCDYVALLNAAKHTLKFRSISQEEECYRAGWKRNTENEYEASIRSAIGRYFSGEEAGKLAEQVSVENLVLNLEKASEYSVTYDRLAPDGAIRRKQVQYRWLDETKSEILVVQTDITAAYVQEQERTRQLQAALADAEEANRAKSEFVSRISHDIRTPISAITSMTAFAKADVDDREKLLHDLSRIEVSNSFLLSLINDVLDISKIDSGKIELYPEPYPYDEYIENIRSIFEPLCRERGQNFRLIVSKPAGGHGVLVDKIRYNQISLNLLSNAVKYTPPGGTITYASRAKKRDDGMVECSFEVSDTGIGMSEQFQKTMFEPFSQEYDNPGRRALSAGAGTGLGLSIVRRLVGLMGGSIRVQSKQGEGTRISVSFVLPDALSEKGDPAGRAEKESRKGRRLSGTVLLAEDNEINVEIAKRILESLGLSVACAENGARAVEMFSASPDGRYRAVLMDIQMPVMNGYDATKAIRAMSRPDAKTIPIIAMTADVFTAAIERSRAAGMTDYVTKPIDPETLSGVLSRALRRRRKTREPI